MDSTKNDITTIINRDFRIVLKPKNQMLCRKYREFLVGAGQLHKYITSKNAQASFKRALESSEDRTVVKFRKYGTVRFYVK